MTTSTASEGGKKEGAIFDEGSDGTRRRCVGSRFLACRPFSLLFCHYVDLIELVLQLVMLEVDQVLSLSLLSYCII